MTTYLNLANFAVLPQSTVTPTSANQLITKTYADNGFVNLTTAQSVAGVKTFSTGISTAAFTLSAAPSAGYVLTSDASGVASWQAPVDFATASIQTTDATPTNLLSIALAANSCVTLSGTLAASDAAFGSGVGGSFNITAYRAAGAAVGLADPVVIVSSDSAATFTAVLSGNNLIVQVTGVAATTINWKTQYNTIIIV